MRARNYSLLTICILLVVTPLFAGRIDGPLRVLGSNRRYFTDAGGKAVYLTGSHTWNNLVDITRLPGYPAPVFDYGEFLNFLKTRNLNCFRLWTWENAFSFDSTGTITYRQQPTPYMRTGPGKALDGLPRFDLHKFNPAYFDRLRERVKAANDAGIYTIVMLFQGFSYMTKSHDDPWKGHPLNAANNINGIDGDPDGDGKGMEIRNLDFPALTAIQESYVRKVINTVNDLDNVLYEITNEDTGGEANTQWQYHMIEYIRQYESGLANQHPVGMTVQYWEGTNSVLFASPADWISPNSGGGYQTDPPAADGSKVILNDTDHSFYYTGLKAVGEQGMRAWVWKNFTRGNQLMFMDPYLDPTPWYVTTRNNPQDGKPDRYYEVLRYNMGYAKRYADRMNLAAMTPQCELASTGFCLANTTGESVELLVYIPRGPWVTVDLSGVPGQFTVEWFNPATDETTAGEMVQGGARRQLAAPFKGDAVLYLARVVKSRW